MGWGMVGEVRNSSLDRRGGPGRVGGRSEKSETVRSTFWEVWDG